MGVRGIVLQFLKQCPKDFYFVNPKELQTKTINNQRYEKN